MQYKMIEALAPARTEDEFIRLFPKVFSILKSHIKALPHATKEDLTISRTLSKTEYTNNIAQKIILKQMAKEGFDVKPGMTIAYVIKDANNKNPLKRYVTIDSFNGKFDLDKYTDLMIRAAFGILQPFRISIKEIYKNNQQLRQSSLKTYIPQENNLKIIS